MSYLPLFPLNTVLFPGTILPLHVFEERYKQMIGACLEENSRFGVVLIRSGEEVGGPPAGPTTSGPRPASAA
jgi:Lon protease-like protein